MWEQRAARAYPFLAPPETSLLISGANVKASAKATASFKSCRLTPERPKWFPKSSNWESGNECDHTVQVADASGVTRGSHSAPVIELEIS